MKIALIIILIFVSTVLGVLLYESTQRLHLREFPGEKIEQANDPSPVPLFLYLFFSLEDSPRRLDIILELNKLPSYFKVRGIVPDDELKDEARVRRLSRATFPLFPISRYWQYRPFFSPTILCVSERGKIFFILPVLPTSVENFKSFILIFYQNISTSLFNEKK